MIRPLVVAALAIFSVSACAPVETYIERFFPSEAAAPLPPPREVRLAVAPPVPRRKPAVNSVAISAAISATISEAVAEVALADADPRQLVGLDFDGTKALLGDPADKKEQPPAEVWAYAGGGCMINVFFFPSVNDKVFRVLTIEVTDGVAAESTAPKIMDQNDPAVRRCFANLLHNHQAPNAG